jgi:dihydroorotate dehydrogenase
MVFKGPYVASTINKELSNLLKKDGLKNVSDAIGVNIN